MVELSVLVTRIVFWMFTFSLWLLTAKSTLWRDLDVKNVILCTWRCPSIVFMVSMLGSRKLILLYFRGGGG